MDLQDKKGSGVCGSDSDAQRDEVALRQSEPAVGDEATAGNKPVVVNEDTCAKEHGCGIVAVENCSDMASADSSDARQCDSERDSGLALFASRVVSIVLQPLLMPLYALLILLKGNSFMALLVPTNEKLFLVLVVAVCTLVIPALALGLLNAVGALEDLRMNKHKERIVPLIIILGTYSLCAYIIMSRTSADLIFIAMLTAISCILLALVVTPFWKISLHMTGIGGVYAILLFLGMVEVRDFTGAMMVATILVGLLAWARLYLGRHTPAQVAAGFLGGFTVASLTIYSLTGVF